MWMTKKKLKKEVEYLKSRIDELVDTSSELNYRFNDVVKFNSELADKVEEYMSIYPLTIGQTVYDVQLRNSKGRYTKSKACREYSVINEVVVDKKNYFNLVDRLHAKDVFVDRDEALKHLDAVCID